MSDSDEPAVELKPTWIVSNAEYDVVEKTLRAKTLYEIMQLARTCSDDDIGGQYYIVDGQLHFEVNQAP